MKNYLVTGGSGFIGAGVVKKLLEGNNNVRVLDNNSRGRVRRLDGLSKEFEFVEGDIRNPDVVLKSTKNIDSVIHLAYVNGTEFFYDKPDLVLDVGVKGMVNIIDACIKNNIKEFVLASSSETYQTPPVVPTPENVPLVVPDPMNPRYSYGGGKIICELMAINYGRKFFDRTTIFRPHNVYGPDMGLEHVVPQLSLRLKSSIKTSNGRDIDFPIQGDGSQKRSFIYIDDFIDALDLILKNPEEMGIFHIGTRDEITIKQLTQYIGECAGYNLNIQPGPLQEGSTPRRCPDIKKIESLGFQPKYTTFEGLKKTVTWYLENDLR